MTPAEALWSATRGGALALARDELGRLSPGGPAHYVVLDAPSYVHLAYRPGVPLVLDVRGGPTSEPPRADPNSQLGL